MIPCFQNSSERVEEAMHRELNAKEALILRLQQDNNQLRSVIADQRLSEVKKPGSKSQEDCGILKVGRRRCYSVIP